MTRMRVFSLVTSRFRAVRHVVVTRPAERLRSIDSPWVRVTAETMRQVKRDDVTLMAAGVAYYAVLSLFPLTLLLLSILRLFADSATSRARLENFFSVYLPDSVGFVDQISGRDTGVSSLVGVVGFIGLIWGATAMISALTRAINRAFDVKTNLPFYKDRPRSILFGFGVLTAFAVSLFSSAAIESVAQFDVPVIGRQAWVQVFARLVPFILTVTTFALIYKLLPSVHPNWNNVMPAALLAAVLFELAKIVFLLYLNRVASFEIYGGMTLLVVLLVWSYFSALVVLVGAEVVAVRRQFAQETSNSRGIS